MRKKSHGTHEKQIISMSVLSPTSHLTLKITQYFLPSQLNFNLNQTVIPSEKVTLKSLEAGFFNSLEIAGVSAIYPRIARHEEMYRCTITT
jgi:hypothetical protein